MIPSVFGREAELAVIEDFARGMPRHAACLVFEGVAGIGKSTVWRVAVNALRAAGALVLACRPAESETHLTFAGLGDLFADVDDERLAGLRETQRSALDVALLRAPPGTRRPDEREVAVAVRSALQLLAQHTPVVVAVDDAQWLDAETASALAFSARRLDGDRIRFVAAVRTNASSTPTFDTYVAPEERVVVRVGPLSLSALHDLTSDRLDHVFLRPTLAKLQEASGGNPFVALEIARSLVANGEPPPGAPLPVPDDVRELVWTRVSRLPDDARAALLTATALASPTTKLVDADALRPAVDADLVQIGDDGRVSFTHPLFASAVYESASPARRSALHRNLAKVVDDAQERARHLALATDEPDALVADALEAAAVTARERGAWESAAELLTRARELTPPDAPDEFARRGVAAAIHYLGAGDRRRTKAVLDEVIEEIESGPLRGDALRLLAELAYSHGSLKESAALFEEAIQFTEDPGLVSLDELGGAYVSIMQLDLARASEHVERALVAARESGVDAVIAEALAVRTFINFLAARGIDWDSMTQALQSEDTSRFVPMMARPSSIAALLTLFGGRFDEARQRLHGMCAFASDRGDERDLPLFLGSLAMLEVWTGNFAAAEEHAAEAVRAAALTDASSASAWALAQRAFVRAHQGDADACRADCASAYDAAARAGWMVPVPWIAAAQCLLELSYGDADAAWTAVDAVVTLSEAEGFGEPLLTLYVPDAVEALVTRGDVAHASALLAAFVTQAERLERTWARAAAGRARGLLLAADGDLAAAEAALEQTLELHDEIDLPFERARVLLALGQVQRRARKRAGARPALEEAVQLFERCGATRFASVARDEVARTHVRQAPSELSPTERSVAELAAQGHTNNEIAKRLFVSVKTVEANLSRAYAKLGIRSRAELALALRGKGPAQL